MRHRISIYEGVSIRPTVGWSFHTCDLIARCAIFIKPIVMMQYWIKISYLILLVPKDASLHWPVVLVCFLFCFFLLTQRDFFIWRGPNSSLRRDRGRRPTTRLYKVERKKQREIMRRNCNWKSRLDPDLQGGPPQNKSALVKTRLQLMRRNKAEI